ncbi:MAG: LysE family translocator [Saprospiraceae bacterium]|nr:LysE family translocator [Saprospiraceae bacterium]
MFGIINFGTLIFAGILLNITPGADTMYILGRSIANGKKAGVLSALGISTGSLVHTTFAALGLSVILAESQAAFNAVKYAGAVYLIYLGIKALLSNNANNLEPDPRAVPVDNRRIFLSGVLTNVLNPKVAIFYLAFLPQFIDPHYPHHFFSFLLLGITFTTTGTIWCMILAVFAARLSQKIRDNYRIKTWLDRVTGLVFIALGIKLALSKR